MNRRRVVWLLVALLLFGAAAWLMSRSDREEQVEAAKVEFPRHQTSEEYERMTKRRTLPVVVAPPAPVGGPEQPAKDERPPPPRDPVLAALPRQPGKTVLVVEANALTQSPVGQLLIACARREGRGEDPFEVAKRKLGVDMLKDLDRVAVSSKGMLVTGQFGQAKWDELSEGARSESYGDKGTVWESLGGSDKEDATALGRWGDGMMIVGDSAQDVKDTIDRLEGRDTTGQPILNESATYGEAYGVLGTDLLQEILGREQPELAKRVEEAVQRAELHVSAMGDVGVVAQLDGQDREKVQDLAKSLGAALSLARLKAQAEGETALAELLDLAKVSPQGDSFNLELALPQAFVEKKLAFCKEPKPPRPTPPPEPAPEPTGEAAPK